VSQAHAPWPVPEKKIFHDAERGVVSALAELADVPLAGKKAQVGCP
jgi:hypothetical protein